MASVHIPLRVAWKFAMMDARVQLVDNEALLRTWQMETYAPSDEQRRHECPAGQLLGLGWTNEDGQAGILLARPERDTYARAKLPEALMLLGVFAGHAHYSAPGFAGWWCVQVIHGQVVCIRMWPWPCVEHIAR